MTIGLYSPLPPVRSGVADYSAALIAVLERHARIVANSPGDANLYQIGNNRLHAADVQTALARPGVVTLHDASLQHLYLATLTEDEYAAEFVYNYGAWFASLGRDLYRARGGSGLREEFTAFPMLRRIVAGSKRIVVHNGAAAAAVQAHGGSPVVIPHLNFPAQASDPRGAHDGVTFALFGYLRESKRVLPVLRAFHRVHALAPRTRLLLAGSWVSDDLPRAAAALLDHPAIRVTGYLEPRAFERAAESCDVCLNLRHPSLGETSGVTVRLMSMGKPVIVTAGRENCAFPPGSVIPVEAGPGEEDALVETMLWLAGSRTVRGEIGRIARAHIAAEHDPAVVAARYWEVLCSLS